jgi:glycosyltransferase involved in cell wall biosynthesis
MKIAYFTSEYPKRSHTFIRREIEAIEQMGLPLTILSIRKPSKSEILCKQDQDDYDRTWSILPIAVAPLIGIHLKSFLFSPVKYIKALFLAIRHRLPGIKSFLYSIFYFIEAIVLANKLAKNGIKHVHVHFANVGSTITFIASKYADFTWSMTLHGTADYEYPHGVLLGEKIRNTLFTACISNFGKAQALRTVNHSYWDKIFVYRCGIHIETLPNRESPSKEVLTIICIARMSSEKGLMGFITACNDLKGCRNIRVVLIGDGPDRDEIEAEIDKNSLRDIIKTTGYVSEEDVLKYLANSDILAVPSLMEGIPVVLMEAMAMGVSVVAPRLSGIPELIEDNKEGLLYTPADWNDFRDKLDSVINNSELRISLQSKAKDKVINEFSFNHCVKPLFEKLNSLN